MEKPKMKLVKSKSSNTAVITKSEPKKNNKKSRSNAEFKPLILKKRGVYVEKKPTKTSLTDRERSPISLSKRSSPRRIPSRPDRKGFLDSVLTILSQSTTGTQFPDQGEPDRKKVDRTKAMLKKRRDETKQEDSNTSPNSSKRKQRHKSRILNDKVDSEFEQLEVLQAKGIKHTPSNNYSKSKYKDAPSVKKEHATIKWADMSPQPVKKNLDNTVTEDTKDVNAKNKDTIVELTDKDSSTLVAEVPNNDDEFYHFLADFLDTSFSVDTEFNRSFPSSVTSKHALEINENVPQKLDISRKPSPNVFYSIQPDEKQNWDDKRLLEHFQPKINKRPRPASSLILKRKQRLKSESFIYKAKPIPKAISLTTPNKRISLQKPTKKNFINLLKKQLKMEINEYKEPQNFFEALKVIAKNKRRCQKSTHFRDTENLSERDVNVCRLKRRKVLTASKKSSAKKSNFDPVSSFKSLTHKRRTFLTKTSQNEMEFYKHPLKVYGYDYDPVAKKLAVDRDFLSSWKSMQDYNVNQDLIMDYSDTILY